MSLKSCAMIVAAIACASTASNGLAAQAISSDAQKARPPADPNQVICEDITSVGSRLATKRQCMTRAQWAEKRKADQEFVQDLQAARQHVQCSSPEAGGGQHGMPSC